MISREKKVRRTRIWFLDTKKRFTKQRETETEADRQTDKEIERDRERVGEKEVVAAEYYYK